MQAGSRKGRGTKDQITNLTKAQEHQQPLFLCFVDFRKAFDSVQYEKLWFNMPEMGYPPHLRWIYSLNFIVKSKL